MKLRNLAWLCPHERLDAHPLVWPNGEVYKTCPGGVFLPDDTLIIEKVDGEWPRWAVQIIADVVADPDEDYLAPMEAVGILDALSVREAE